MYRERLRYFPTMELFFAPVPSFQVGGLFGWREDKSLTLCIKFGEIIHFDKR